MQLGILLVSCFTTLTLACIPTKAPSPGIPVPECKKCAKSLIQIDTTTAGTIPFATEPTIDMSGSCSVITFQCTGQRIVVNTDELIIYDPPTGYFTCNGEIWQDTDDTVDPPIITNVNTIACVV